MIKGHFQIFFSCIVVVFITALSHGQDLNHRTHLSISNGLAHNGVTSIIQGSNGLVWIGTYDGLNLYDGYQLKTFKNTNHNNILLSNRIRSLAEDNNGNIWIGTEEGLTVYNYSNNVYSNMHSNEMIGSRSGPVILNILVDEDRVLCGTENDGIIIFDDQQQLIGQYRPSISSAVYTPAFYDGLKLTGNEYLFSTSNGLFVFDIDKKSFEKVLDREIDFSNFVTPLDKKSLVVGMRNGIGLIDIDYKDGIRKETFKKQNFVDTIINSASLDIKGQLWLGTSFDGIIKIKDVKSFVDGKQFNYLTWERDTPGTRFSLVYSTAKSGCWVGTLTHGIFLFDLDESPFFYYNSTMGFKHGVESNEVLKISVFDEDRVLISTHRGGIGLYNTHNNVFDPLPFDIPDGVNPLRITSAFVDSQKNIWLRIPGPLGLGVVKKGTRSIQQVNPPGFPQLNRSVLKSIYEDRNGNLWFGTMNDLYKLRLNDTADVINIESINTNPGIGFENISPVYAIYEDPEFNYIWVGTMKDGLLRIGNGLNDNLKDAKIDQFQLDPNEQLSISSNFVTSIVRTNSGHLWVGTEGGGICKVLDSDKDPQFVALSEKDGLSNNVVKDIVVDDKNNLWVPTNIGLNRIDSKSLEIKNFLKADGIPFEDFVYSTAKLDNGNFVFSGLDGFFYFNPHDIPEEEPLLGLMFGDLKLFNETVHPGDTVNGRVVLRKRLNDLSSLDLKFKENVFSIEVISLHFSTPDNHYVKYRIEPVSPDWVKVVSDQKFIHFTGLTPGTYKLSVMASNSYNQWTAPRQITINIAPPFWQTRWAYGLYVFFFLIIMWGIIEVMLNILNLKTNLKLKQIEKEMVQEANDAKLRFFVNIAHEIKTPMTLISGPVNTLLEQYRGNKNIRERLQIVNRQMRRTFQLLEQVQDFHKSEHYKLRLNYSTFSFDCLLVKLVKDFEFTASQEDKKLIIKRQDESNIWINADHDKIEVILNNLLNNALKFTSEGDEIEVNYLKNSSELILEVSDTGKGISPDDLAFIFDRFYQGSNTIGFNNIGGCGIGLAYTRRLIEMHYGVIDVDSEPGKGTKFMIRLPVLTNVNDLDSKKIIENILSLEKNSETDYLELNSNEAISVDPQLYESKVFLVEDNVDMREYISDILSTYFQVVPFADGKKCLHKLDEEWPDIIISDVMMPEMNGFKLCEKVKSDIKTSHIPVVLLTACSSMDDQIKGIKGGADAYVEKPFNIKHLVTTIESLLIGRKQLRERYQMDLPLTFDQGNNDARDHVFLEKLYRLISENIDNQDLDVDQFAKSLYLNRTHFYQKVKAITGFTPYELLKVYRLKKAAELLVYENVSVAEVSTMTGFKSRTHFSKIFKEKYSTTPGNYANAMKKKFLTEVVPSHNS